MADCPSCGQPLIGDPRFCPCCGASLPAPAEDPTPTPINDAVTAVADRVAPQAGRGATPGRVSDGAQTAVLHVDEVTTSLAVEEPTQSLGAHATLGLPSRRLTPGGRSSAAGESDGTPTAAMDEGCHAARTQIMVPPASTSRCDACGQEALYGDDLFCAACGAARAEARETPAMPAALDRACAACGATLAHDMRFCPTCGAHSGDVETAASREETLASPAAFRSATPPPAVPPATPGSSFSATTVVARPLTPSADRRPHLGRTALIAAVTLVVLAGCGVGAWWFLLRDSTAAAREDFVAQATPVLAPVSDAQRAMSGAIHALDAADRGSFSALADTAATLQDVLAAAASAAAGMPVDDEVRGLRDQLLSALDVHVIYAGALADMPEEPAELTSAKADVIATRASSVRSAYESLSAAAPGLPRIDLAPADDDHLADVAAQVQEETRARAQLSTFVESIAELFGSSRTEREGFEQILAQFESVELPPDNAAGRMEAAAADLRGIATRIEGSTPPEDQAATKLRDTYREAVEHLASAAALYAKWMWTAHEYYQVAGWYPEPAQGHEADLYLDPAYDSARKEQDLAATARESLAAAYNDLAAALGLPAGMDSASM